MKRFLFSVICTLLAFAGFAQEQIAIKHGPYLQNLKETETTIVWVANKASVGWVEVAPDDGTSYYRFERSRFFDSTNGVKNVSELHAVRITGLKPGTSYRYRIYSQEVLERKGEEIVYGNVAAPSIYDKRSLKFTTNDRNKPATSFIMLNDIHGNTDYIPKLLNNAGFKETDMIIYNGDMMKKEKYILIMLSLFICAYLFSNRMTPRIENIASKEINQFIQILINHTSFTQKIDTHKLYKKENNSISFQMNYINDIASNYINNLEETLLKLEEGSYQENNHSPYNKKLLKINQQKGIVARIPIGSLTNNIFLQDRGPSFSIKYKTLSLTSSNIDKKIKNYGINHLAISIDLNVTIVLQILVPLYHEHFKENYTIPLVYEVIEGEVPSWYQN